ncbi:MAG TPA: hypothetical protein VGV86_09750 [Acidimicrobiales bacterium]|nr:hypothetical protein [Acidimicrobiales bacterium]
MTGELGSYRWEAAPPSVAMCRHVDCVIEGPNPAQTLTVIQGETVTLRYDPALPVESVVTSVWNGAPGSATFVVPASNPAPLTSLSGPGSDDHHRATRPAGATNRGSQVFLTG